MSIQKKTAEGEWSEMLAIPKEDVCSLSVMGFASEGRHCYMTDRVGPDTSGRCGVAFASGGTNGPAPRHGADVGAVV